MNKRTAQNGFTLIELLIVIVIIGILAAIILVILNPALQRDRARDAVVLASLNKVAAEVQAFANSDITGQGNFPTGQDLLGNNCGNGSIQNVVPGTCAGITNGVSGSSTFSLNSVVTGISVSSDAGFTFNWDNSAMTKTFCISAPLNVKKSDGTVEFIMLDYPVNATPVKDPKGC